MDVYSLPPMPVNWDAIGIFYIAFAVAWTILVLGGAIFLIANRRSPVLRVRGTALSLTAIFFLHAYWILAQLVYPIGASMPVLVAYDVQYFVMGIWFPLGIALFHASNSRFLYVAKMQRQFVPASGSRTGGDTKSGSNGGGGEGNAAVRLGKRGAAHLQCAMCRLKNLDYPTRVVIYISIGIFFQILLTVGMWLACRKYHPEFGIDGTEIHGATVFEQIVDMGRGWEWWPSVLWQLVWTWIVAPVLIWQAWGIHDTLGWRVQTVGCCLASLHSVPMWLVATYHPAFAPINVYFAPSQWLHLSTMFFEIFAIFVPCYLVIQDRVRSRRPASVRSESTGWSCDTYIEKGVHADILATLDDGSGSNARLFSMKALELQLEKDPSPLQGFSALRDFSGENIAFLTSVRTWKAGYDDSGVRNAFSRAVEIYADYVSPRDAEFPLNLSSHQLKHLDAIFKEPTARTLSRAVRVNEATPFDLDGPDSGSDEEKGFGRNISTTTKTSTVRYTGEIPDGFDASVFDAAVDHVKQLVLTNTWPKFITEGRTLSRYSAETSRTEFTARSSGSSLLKHVSEYINSIF